ncbi:MAG: hypothetical protein ACR2KK_03515, partial [Acidimicrobiales bacterium]
LTLRVRSDLGTGLLLFSQVRVEPRAYQARTYRCVIRLPRYRMIAGTQVLLTGENLLTSSVLFMHATGEVRVAAWTTAGGATVTVDCWSVRMASIRSAEIVGVWRRADVDEDQRMRRPSAAA